VAWTNIAKQAGTFWQDELASFDACVFGAGGPLGLGRSLCTLFLNMSVAKNYIF
jgi:hypothetical protein